MLFEDSSCLSDQEFTIDFPPALIYHDLEELISCFNTYSTTLNLKDERFKDLNHENVAKCIILENTGFENGAFSINGIHIEENSDSSDPGVKCAPKKSHSVSYPYGRRRAIAPDETDVSKDLTEFHLNSPFYANWKLNCDAITYFRRRKSLPQFTENSNSRIDSDTKNFTDSFWSLSKLIKNHNKRPSLLVEKSEFETCLETSISKMGLCTMEMSKFFNYEWSHWTHTNNKLECSKNHLYFLNALWELFVTEADFLDNTLMVLKNVYMETLKSVQVDGFLMDAEPEILFGNLDELCSITTNFCEDAQNCMKGNQFDVIVVISKLMGIQDGNSNKEMYGFKNKAYHKYCLNYLNALNHLYILRFSQDFRFYEKLCHINENNRKRNLSDLLISPVQYYMKIPLLIKNIVKRCSNIDLNQCFNTLIQDLDTSIGQLEDKMIWMKNYKRLQEIEEVLVWPCQKYDVSKNYQIKPINIANPRRKIIHEGNLTLQQKDFKQTKIRLFLFDDLMIVTQIKKWRQKRETMFGRKYMINYEVLNQIIDIDKFVIYDFKHDTEAGNTKQGGRDYSNMFMVKHLTKYRETVAQYLFLADSTESKNEWIKHIKITYDNWNANLNSSSTFLKN